MGDCAQWKQAGVTSPGVSRRSGLPLRRKCVRFLKRICTFARAATVGFLLLLMVCMHYRPNQYTPEPSLTVEESPVTLLIWTHPFGQYRQLPDCLELYQIRGCALTDDVSAYLEADAVIIHHREIATGSVDLPPEPRPRAQKWIWMNYESPSHTPNLVLFEGIFNLTMSYRSDSDIFLPYGYLVPRARKAGGLQSNFAHPLSLPSYSNRLRYRFVAWVISNWSESHVRVAFFYQLRRYIHIDVFGRAGRPLPQGSGNVVQLIGGYMFYLALENSQHTDYVTEKLWNAVMAGTVPVVLGPSRQNYERFLPPEAFIHVDDFPTVQELARYLLLLRRDPAKLKRHLDWRGSYSLHQPFFWDEYYCTACRVVRRTRGKTDVVNELTPWFIS
ncbi:alpha-(1,3)-fucosyltransferase 4-like [Melanotaenia boesemani]|uniref:alpha-(1,3)-fucosyltransferase 4-like n=1 Tax=Melanotaenia boesemani TaxID=1250792 RepID=UPI001C05D32A|nr:alpha-(1,3)-fucosyltransferase 4-like [Melanotaenia boesemani]